MTISYSGYVAYNICLQFGTWHN